MSQTDYIVRSSNTDSLWVYRGGWRNIAIDSNGRIWVAYTFYPDAPINYGASVYVDYSDDGGTTWANSLTMQSYRVDIGGVDHTFRYDWPSIAVDSSNRVYIVYEKIETWAGGNALRSIYSKYHSVGWELELVVGTTYFGGSGASIVVDSFNNVHVVYPGEEGEDSGVRYAKLSTGTWGSHRWLSTMGDYAVIAIDDDNNLHVVWGDDDVGEDTRMVKYRFCTSFGSWSGEENVSYYNDALFEGAYQNHYPSIVIDGDGGIHVVWRGYNTEDYSRNTFYRSKIGGNWNTQEIVILANSPPNISIDRNDVLWVVVEADSGSVYTRRVGGSWTDGTLLASSGAYTGTQMWATRPIISTVHTNIHPGGFYVLWEHDVGDYMVITFTKLMPSGKSFASII